MKTAEEFYRLVGTPSEEQKPKVQVIEPEVAEGEASGAREEAMNLCPQCKANVQWLKQPLVEGPLGFLSKYAYRICPRCHHQERVLKPTKAEEAAKPPEKGGG
jgi:uncharacterized protein with PIN domain